MSLVRYTMTVTLTVPVDEGAGGTPEGYTTPPEVRRLEREIIHHLRKMDGDADCEVMVTETLTDDGEVVHG
jgi:hypothetical protein